MIAAAVKGEPFDAVLGGGAKQRSKHNTFLAVPTTFIMISNHFPTATYGNHYAVAVLGALILVGWVAAGVLPPPLFPPPPRPLPTNTTAPKSPKPPPPPPPHP